MQYVDLFGTMLSVKATDVADHVETLGGIGKVDRHLGAHRRGVHDALFGAAVSSCVLTVLGRARRPRRTARGAPQQANRADSP